MCANGFVNRVTNFRNKVTDDSVVMNSCFPPLAGLNINEENTASSGIDKRRKKRALRCCESISNSINDSSTKNKGERQTTLSAVVKNDRNGKAMAVGKVEVLQDLDLYFIKQIAHNLKVGTDDRQITNPYTKYANIPGRPAAYWLPSSVIHGVRDYCRTIRCCCCGLHIGR